MATDNKEIDDDKFAQPQFNQGRYINPTSFTNWLEPPSFLNPSNWGSFIQWMFREKDHSGIPGEEIELQKTLPVEKPQFPVASTLAATWLGHATVYVRIDGLSLITDPVWAQYASPLSRYGCRRYRPPPCEIKDLPEINVAVISHNHYDHLDSNAVKTLSEHFPQIQWFVPRGLGPWMRSTIGQKATINELSWGEHMEVELVPNSGEKFKIWSVPAQHWSQRGLCDRNKTLWCGWLVEGSRQHKFFYTGDTGFCKDEFGKIGHRFGPIDLSAIPIGCYSPRWFMQPQHIDPAEAVQIHKLAKSRKSIAIHWGTYKMGSTEPYMEPISKLREQAQADGLKDGEFVALAHGESWRIEEEGERRRTEDEKE